MLTITYEFTDADLFAEFLTALHADSNAEVISSDEEGMIVSFRVLEA